MRYLIFYRKEVCACVGILKFYTSVSWPRRKSSFDPLEKMLCSQMLCSLCVTRPICAFYCSMLMRVSSVRDLTPLPHHPVVYRLQLYFGLLLPFPVLLPLTKRDTPIAISTPARNFRRALNRLSCVIAPPRCTLFRCDALLRTHSCCISCWYVIRLPGSTVSRFDTKSMAWADTSSQ